MSPAVAGALARRRRGAGTCVGIPSSAGGSGVSDNSNQSAGVAIRRTASDYIVRIRRSGSDNIVDSMDW